MAVEKKLQFNYEKDGVVLNFAFSLEDPEKAEKQMKIFEVMLGEALVDIKKTIQTLQLELYGG